jgi:glycosyltransferase involved in cell wall biosynthesis
MLGGNHGVPAILSVPLDVMRVLHCITGLTGDGAQRVLLRLAESMRSLGVQSAVVNLGAPTQLVSQFEAAGVSVWSLNMRASAGGIASAVRRLKQLAEQARPDIIQGWMYHANLVTALWSLASGRSLPILWNIRRGLDDYTQRRLRTRCIIRGNAVLSSRVDGIIYCSPESKAQHEEFGFNLGCSVVFGNGFDTEKFRPRPEYRRAFREQHRISDDELVVGNIGRFDVAKGHAFLIEAFSRVLVERPNVRLVLVGRGMDDSNGEILSRLDSLGCRERVLLLGEQNNVETIHPAFDIYCSSSISEGFPNALSEAMACEVACVTTDTGASRQLVEGIGRVVPARSTRRLVEALLATASDSAETRRASAARGRERIVSRYALSTVAQEYADLYKALV